MQECTARGACGARKYLSFLAAATREFEAQYYLRVSDTTFVAPESLALAAQQVHTFHSLPVPSRTFKSLPCEYSPCSHHPAPLLQFSLSIALERMPYALRIFI
jgi:hypothetical protein